MKRKLLLIAMVVLVFGFVGYDLTLYPIEYAKDINKNDEQAVNQIVIINTINEPQVKPLWLYGVGLDLKIKMETVITDEKQIKAIKQLFKSNYLVKKSLKIRGGKINYIIRFLNDTAEVTDEYGITAGNTVLVGERAAMINSFGAYESESIMNQSKRINELKAIIKDYE